jgi:hypothetical protein
MPPPFVPDDFEPPLTLTGDGFRLEPLGPQHNERDHDAWTSSIEWIRSTPGYGPDDEWPAPMSVESNLKDLEMHAGHFTERSGFTYSILDRDDVIGCLYIYPGKGRYDASIRSWVRANRSEMDVPVFRAVTAWIDQLWPFASPEYAPRHES